MKRKLSSLVWNRWLADVDFDVREVEYGHALDYLADCHRIVDVACGTGTFLTALAKQRGVVAKGVDLNPENVEFARARGLDVSEGNALALDFAENSFDGLHCSHLMQVFGPDQAQQLVREINRVVQHDGVIVITTLNCFDRFYRHPENARPYPPDALWRYALRPNGATSPMYAGMPRWRQEDIWLRRPPLFELISFARTGRNSAFARLNALQMKWGLTKRWTFDAYTVKLRVNKQD